MLRAIDAVIRRIVIMRRIITTVSPIIMIAIPWIVPWIMP